MTSVSGLGVWIERAAQPAEWSDLRRKCVFSLPRNAFSAG